MVISFRNKLMLLGMLELTTAQTFSRCPNPSADTSSLFNFGPSIDNPSCIMAGPSRLYQGQSITNGDCVLSMQGDGNLILWRSGEGKPAWDTGASGYQITPSEGFFAAMQPDGNLVTYLYKNNAKESENKPVFATHTSQPDFQDPNTISELWMSDGSQGYCRLYILWDNGPNYITQILWQSVRGGEFHTAGNTQQYLYPSQILHAYNSDTYCMILQHDCNLVIYSQQYGDNADVNVSADLVWSAGYVYHGNDKCVFTQETDGTFSIYLISDDNQWSKVWSLTNYMGYLGGYQPGCTWWRMLLGPGGPIADCD